jgi:hypothetical protein
MANKNNRDNDLNTDELLKQVLKDDLPPEVEGRMKANFTQFRATLELDSRTSEQTLRDKWKSLFQLNWAVRREVLAFSSLVMIVAGAFLHVSGHRSAMADTLSFLNISVSVTDQIENVSSMECRLQVPAKDEKHRSFVIRWLSPETTQVCIFEKDRASKSLLIKGSEVTLNDHVHNSSQKFKILEHIKDPVFQPALEFLSPMILATAIYERWKPQHFRENAEGQKGTFVFVDNGERITLEMTVDMNTSLPLSIKKYTSNLAGTDDVYELAAEALFTWNEPISLININEKSEKGRRK